jgi:predicted DNA-binding protein (MmcQ/YjbR family)
MRQTEHVTGAADDDRDLERIRAICAAFPEAEEDVLQDRPLFHVRRRRFAIFNGEDSPPRPRWNGCGRSLHLLTDPKERDALGQDERFSPSPHHGDRGWFMIRLHSNVDWAELAELLEAAYRQAGGLK